MVTVFQNYTLNQTITTYSTNSFQNIYSFQFSCLSNKTFFVIDSQSPNPIIKFDQNGNFVGALSFSNQPDLFYMTQQSFSITPFMIDNQTFYIMTSNEVIYKFDSNMALINHYVHGGVFFYNSYINTNESYVMVSCNWLIFVFDLDLTFKKYLFVGSASNIVEYQGLLYFGDVPGRVGIIQKDFSVSYFQTQCTSAIISLAIDKNGCIAVLCDDTTGNIYVYDQSGTKINIDWLYQISGSTFIGFDEKENFIVTSKTGINIFKKKN